MQKIYKDRIVNRMAVMGILLLFLLSGCALLPNAKESQTPAEWVEENYYALHSGELTLSQFYKKYISEESKALTGFEDFQEQEKDRLALLFSEDCALNQVEIQVTEDLTNGIMRIQSQLHFTADGENPQLLELTEYILQDESGMKYVYDGLLSRNKYTMATPESPKLYFSSADIRCFADGVEVSMEVVNSSVRLYSIGFEHGAAVVIQTPNGEYRQVLDKAYMLSSTGEEKVQVFFKDVQGPVQKITLENLFTLDVYGNKMEDGEGHSYSVSVQ